MIPPIESHFIAEMVGTMILILLGDGVVANVLLNKSKGQNSGWIVIAAGRWRTRGTLISASGTMASGSAVVSALAISARVASGTGRSVICWRICCSMRSIRGSERSSRWVERRSCWRRRRSLSST